MGLSAAYNNINLAYKPRINFNYLLNASCYFRSFPETPYRKALVQVTERCNLHCAHCFVSATNQGDDISVKMIQKKVIPKLKECKVISITITGGEPFIHPDIMEIVQLFRESNLRVGICTNATLINQKQIEQLAKSKNVHINVSLDGFSPNSHGKFRGNKDSFKKTIKTIQQLSNHGLLQGLLVTPNTLTNINEYVRICQFAIKNKAKYVLMNPLSSFGRGVKSKENLRSQNNTMIQIKKFTEPFQTRLQIVSIRFPNNQKLPLSFCEAGSIIYVFTHGEVAVCPYLVFAAKTPKSKHKPEEFIVGNIFNDSNIAEKLKTFKFHERYNSSSYLACKSCYLKSRCGKGCPAAVIASGEKVGNIDKELCPLCSTK